MTHTRLGVTHTRLAWGAAGLVLAASLYGVLAGSGVDLADGLSNQAASSSPFAKQLPAPNANVGPVYAARQAQQAQDALPDPFLDASLRLTFEAILLEVGDAATPELLKQRLAAVVPRHFSPDLATRAFALLQRYVDYRVALGRLAAAADANDPGALRQALDARLAVRQRYFSPEEHNALFAQDAALDRYTVTRLEIERNGQLSAAQKQTALLQAQAELSPAEQAARSEAVAHVGVAAQTAAFDANNTSAQERYQQRNRAYGDAAALRLAAQDQQERDWQARLGQYANASAGPGDLAQLQQLRQQLFSSQEELRLDAALAARAAR